MNLIKKIFGGENKKSLMYSLEQIYKDLKSKNPDKDEHWLLAHTWLARYGNWGVSKQKGPKLTKFIAYKDTFQYSFLDSPKSIKGLAIYLTHKELGEKETKDELEEFSRLMKEIEDTQANGKLLDEYQKRNSFTWNEMKQENDESIYGFCGFLKSADYLNKNSEEQKQIRKELAKLDEGEKSGGIMSVKLSKEQIEEVKRAMEKDN